MSKITLDNLSDNLKAYLEGLGLTEEQVLNLINENGLNEEELKAMLKDTMSINELSTNSKTVIGAINELFQSANNGKELIASAIGEPLSSEDTFSAMSTDINSLLSTFKTNMMNNGVTVESGDKFKSLIDKIATMVEEGNGKGIQYASGTFIGDIGHTTDYTGSMITKSKNFSIDIGFKPTLFMIVVPQISLGDYQQYGTQRNLHLSNICTSHVCFRECDDPQAYVEFNIQNVTESGFTISSYFLGRDLYNHASSGVNSWYAIGVGEEDTTLRDSLASILQEEGVSVTEEDDMASLISKVDEEFDRQVVPQGNATAADVIAGKSFINDTGQLLTGTATLQSLGGEKSKQIIPNWNLTDSETLFMIKNDGSLWAYGYNYYGGLGLGDTNNRNTFTKVTTNINNDVKQVACGKYHTFILKNDGSVWACGYNMVGQLGLGTSGNGTNKNTFTKVTTNINNDVKQIACGSDHTFILKNDGSVWSCGYGGVLGLGDTTQRTTFTQVTTNINNDVKEILCFDEKTYIIKNDDSIWVTGLMFDYTQTTFMQI